MTLVIEDELVGLDDLQEKLADEFEECKFAVLSQGALS